MNIRQKELYVSYIFRLRWGKEKEKMEEETKAKEKNNDNLYKTATLYNVLT